jgi:hypothetical protein
MTLITAISAGAELQEALTKLQGQDANLSIKGALSEAKRLGGKDAEADKILAEIEAESSDGKMLKGAFTRLTMATRNFSRTSILKPERMGSYLGDATEALSRMQISRASLMLLVVRLLTVREPKIWGQQDSPTSHQAAIGKLKEQLEAAYQRITSAITLADLMVHENISDQDRQNGMSRITFRITGDTLCLGDGRDIGPRLVGWWLQNDGKPKAKASVKRQHDEVGLGLA